MTALEGREAYLADQLYQSMKVPYTISILSPYAFGEYFNACFYSHDLQDLSNRVFAMRHRRTHLKIYYISKSIAYIPLQYTLILRGCLSKLLFSESFISNTVKAFWAFLFRNLFMNYWFIYDDVGFGHKWQPADSLDYLPVRDGPQGNRSPVPEATRKDTGGVCGGE